MVSLRVRFRSLPWMVALPVYVAAFLAYTRATLPARRRGRRRRPR